MTIRKRLQCCVALVGAVTLGLAGCSSSGTQSASTTSAGGKSPIKVLMIAVLSNPAFSNPQSAVAAKAYVKQANASGGINGHPIQLEVCDSNLDPNKETATAQPWPNSRARFLSRLTPARSAGTTARPPS